MSIAEEESLYDLLDIVGDDVSNREMSSPPYTIWIKEVLLIIIRDLIL